jgi:hypothetical protein
VLRIASAKVQKRGRARSNTHHHVSEHVQMKTIRTRSRLLGWLEDCLATTGRQECRTGAIFLVYHDLFTYYAQAEPGVLSLRSPTDWGSQYRCFLQAFDNDPNIVELGSAVPKCLTEFEKASIHGRSIPFIWFVRCALRARKMDGKELKILKLGDKWMLASSKAFEKWCGVCVEVPLSRVEFDEPPSWSIEALKRAAVRGITPRTDFWVNGKGPQISCLRLD